ncbi:MAG TPA: hypothetical protein VG488_08420 [Candidatus Angelobacter sp.]|jgi:hypothetical protein|nr:hypothetical protein [Candidatus Angelobacter sp.]
MIAGILVTVVAVWSVRTVYRQIYRFRNRNEDDVASYLLPIDLGELSDLGDILTEEILKDELGPKEFRKAQFKRLRLLQEYTRWMRRNGDVLQEWAEYGYRRRRYAEEDGIKSCSLKLIRACRHFRFGARSIQLDLHIKFLKMKLFPSQPVPMLSKLRRIDASFDLLFAYQAIRVAAEYLSQAYGEDCYESLAQVL